MPSSRFPIVTAVVTLFLAALLVFVILLTLRTAHPTAVVPTQSPDFLTADVPTTSIVSPATDAPDIDAVVSAADTTAIEAATIALGGFRFTPPTGFAVTTGDTSATLTGQATSGVLAPIFLLSGGPSRQFVAQPAASLDEMFGQFVEFFAEQDNFAVGEPVSLFIDDAPARMVDLLGQESDEPFAGRIVMAQSEPDRLFVMTGVAPAAEWEAGAALYFARVLDSVVLLGNGLSTGGAVLAAGQMPTPTPTPTSLPTASPTATEPPTSTPIPLTQPLPTPNPNATVEELPASYANANYVRELAVTDSAVWAATEGGVVAWNHSGGLVAFNAQKGLALNSFVSASYCPLPGLGIVFGADGGLQIFDARNGSWNMLTSANSAMSFDDVSSVRCSEEEGFLTVGYRQHGIDFYDTSTNSWTHVDRNDGLAADSVDHVAVVGDREEIWTASGFGLSALIDGRSRRYTTGNSPLTSNQINALAVGPDDSVWIVAPDALYRVEGQQWSIYSADGAGTDAFPAAALTAVAFESDQVAWIGTADSEVCRFDIEAERCTNLWQSEENMAGGAITSMSVDNGAVYYATDGDGISRYDDGGWRHRIVPGEFLAGNRVRSMVQDANGFVWVASAFGVQQLNAENPTIARSVPYGADETRLDNVQVLAPDRVGGMWLGGVGASYFDGEGWSSFTVADGLAGSIVQAIAIDLQRRVWIGTKTGLSVWNGDTFFNLTRENGLPNDNISSLLAAGDSMWIGSNEGGLFQFQSNQVHVFNRANAGLPSDTITALARGADGTLLVGTDRGAARFRDGVVERFETVPSVEIRSIASLATDSGERIWIATAGDGLYTYDGLEWTHLGVNAGLPSLTITSLLIDAYNTLWVGGENGGISRFEIPR